MTNNSTLITKNWQHNCTRSYRIVCPAVCNKYKYPLKIKTETNQAKYTQRSYSCKSIATLVPGHSLSSRAEFQPILRAPHCFLTGQGSNRQDVKAWLILWVRLPSKIKLFSSTAIYCNSDRLKVAKNFTKTFQSGHVKRDVIMIFRSRSG